MIFKKTLYPPPWTSFFLSTAVPSFSYFPFHHKTISQVFLLKCTNRLFLFQFCPCNHQAWQEDLVTARTPTTMVITTVTLVYQSRTTPPTLRPAGWRLFYRPYHRKYPTSIIQAPWRPIPRVSTYHLVVVFCIPHLNISNNRATCRRTWVSTWGHIIKISDTILLRCPTVPLRHSTPLRIYLAWLETTSLAPGT